MRPFLRDRVGELRDWDDVKLLTVRWTGCGAGTGPGLLCIGDAAHAMSPVGGVGINLAIQDAVAAANLLAAPLRAAPADHRRPGPVQQRRSFPTRATQAFQIGVQNRVIDPVLRSSQEPRLPGLVRFVQRYLPVLQGIPARIVGVGFRPEHVDLDAIDGRVSDRPSPR